MSEYAFSPGGSVIAKLFDQILASAGAFDTGANGIPPGYSCLQLHLIARGDTAIGALDCLIRFNGDTGSNYDDAAFRTNSGSVSTVNDQAQTSAEFGQVTGSNATANYPSSITAFIPNYAGTTFYKQGNYLCTFENVPATPTFQSWTGGFSWRNTAAINQIGIRPTSGNFIIGSRLLIYGLP